MNKNKKIVAIVGASGAAALAVIGGALALFTDNDTDSTSAKAGTVDIEASGLTLTNDKNINPGDNDPDLPPTYKPEEGDPQYDPEDPDKEVPVSTTSHDLQFSIANNGTKSIRSRHTFVLSVKDTSGNYLDARVFQLYDGAKELTGKVYIAADDTEYVDASAIPADTLIKAIRYRFTPDIFDGVGSGAELEDAATVKGDGQTPASKDYSYKLAMDMETPNSYQGSSLEIEAIFEAMQFRNTVQDDWQVVSHESFTASVATSTTTAVPDRTTD